MKRFATKRLFGAVLFCGLALATSGRLAGTAYAGIITCNSDPTVYLSDGHVVVMSATITDSLADVQQVSYTLHVPVGVYATSIVGDNSGIAETVMLVADQPAGHGYSDTYVSTGTPGVPVTAYSAIQGVVQGSATGVSGQHLVLSV